MKMFKMSRLPSLISPVSCLCVDSEEEVLFGSEAKEDILRAQNFTLTD